MDTAHHSPIFVVGVGRSGTTLLSALLSNHARIAITPETHFLRRADLRGPLDGGPPDFDAFWDEYTQWCRFRDLEIDPAFCRRLIDASGDRTFRSIFATALEAYRQKEGKARVGEKTPRHRAYARTLLRWFPRARIVVIQRDPRAVVASQLKCPWVSIRQPSLRKGVFLHSRTSQIVFYARNWAQAFESDVPGFIDDRRAMLVRYETLVNEPEPTLRRICAFLGEQYKPQMLDPRSPAGAARTPTASADRYGSNWNSWLSDHHTRARRPVSTNSISKWKGELSASEVAIIEGFCHQGMRAAGYPLTIPSWRRNAGRVRGVAEQTCQSVERRARSAVSRLRGHRNQPQPKNAVSR